MNPKSRPSSVAVATPRRLFRRQWWTKLSRLKFDRASTQLRQARRRFGRHTPAQAYARVVSWITTAPAPRRRAA